MRLLCPHCSQSIAIADTEAGKPVSCPLCAIVPGPGTIRRFYARSATTPFARNDDTYINLADRRTGIASIAKRAEALLSTKNRGSRTCPVDFPAPGHDAMACAHLLDARACVDVLQVDRLLSSGVRCLHAECLAGIIWHHER